MRNKVLVAIAVAFIVTIFGFGVGYGLKGVQANESTPLSSGEETGIAQKLDEVLANQSEIRGSLEHIKKELAIVKIRI